MARGPARGSILDRWRRGGHAYRSERPRPRSPFDAERAMSIADLLVPELEAELATTRRVLERVPSDQGPWKPHDKSFPMGHLAQLVARLPGWAPMMMDRT